MLHVKRSIHRYFALPMRQFFLFMAKTTILSLFALWALYQGISYYHNRLFNQLKSQVLKQKTDFHAMSVQKGLKTEQEIAALCTDTLRLTMKKRQQHVSDLHLYAEKAGVSILSYQGGAVQKNKESKKELQLYAFQGELDKLTQFLKLLVQEQYPAHCVFVKVLRQQEKNYMLHITLKKYIDYETKPLQPVKQAEGLGGE